MTRETSLRQKLDARTADLAKLREGKAFADAALLDARATLSSSSIPEVSELQQLKDELNAAKSETQRFQKKVNIAAGDMEYMRNNYQKVSSTAAEMRTELDTLRTLNETLTRKASANAVEIHRIQASSEIKQHLQHISELEREKAELERELEKKTEELRSMLNGRRAMRGTSVPRSPRMGTMSPGQSTRPIARVLSGMGSRGTSPAPGGAEGQFRGPGTFGDALFAPIPGSNRWGNHLS
jgi:chromosome segregation ATPase